MTEGYLYVAYGEKFIKEAIASASSLKKYHRDAHITLVTTELIEENIFDNIIILEHRTKGSKGQGYMYKVQGLLKTPYEKTFFVDTDTYFLDSCQELFFLLDYYDILMVKAPGDITITNFKEKQLIGYYPFNTGVIVFKKNNVIINLFKEWEEVYNNSIGVHSHDQASLMEALLKVPARIFTLQPIYNLRTPFPVTIPALKVKILHGRNIDPEDIDKRINKYSGQLGIRSWRPNRGKTINAKSI